MSNFTRYSPLLLLVVIGGFLCWDLSQRQRFPEGVDGNLVLFDRSGQIKATAKLQLPDNIPEMGSIFDGVCLFTRLPSDFPDADFLNGRYSAAVFEREIIFDLTPGNADKNILIYCQLQGGMLHGTWCHSTTAGGSDMGTVLLNRK